MVLTCPSLGDGQIVSMNAAVNPEPRGIIVLVAADGLDERLRAYSMHTTHTNRWVQVYLPVRILRIPLCCSIPHEISGCLEAIIPTAYVDRKALDTHIGSLRELSLVSADILNTTNSHLASYNPVGTNIRLICGRASVESQASPCPSSSVSCCPGLATFTQLSLKCPSLAQPSLSGSLMGQDG